MWDREGGFRGVCGEGGVWMRMSTFRASLIRQGIHMKGAFSETSVRRRGIVNGRVEVA